MSLTIDNNPVRRSHVDHGIDLNQCALPGSAAMNYGDGVIASEAEYMAYIGSVLKALAVTDETNLVCDGREQPGTNIMAHGVSSLMDVRNAWESERNA